MTRPPKPADPVQASARRHPPLFAGLPLIVWVLCALFMSSMLAWSITKATYNSPDEHKHVAAALYWSEFREWPGFKEMPMMLNVMRSHGQDEPAVREATNATSRQERPSFQDLTGEIVVSGKSINQMSQHPPLYYIVLGQLHDLLPSDLAADLEVWLMRLLSVIIMTPLPLLAAALARRLGASRPMTVVAAAGVALLPGLASIGGMVNNDNLLTAASSWALLGAGCVLAGDLRKRTAAWIGLALAVALLSKAFALPVAFAVMLAYLVAIVRTKDVRSGAVVAASIAAGVAMLGGWWWIRNAALYGTLQPAGHGAHLPDGPLSLSEALPVYWDRFLRVFFTRYWAGFDPLDLGDAGLWIFVVASAAAVVIVAAGLVVRLRTRAVAPVVDVLVIVLPFALALASLLSSTVRITMNTGYPAGVQGRYLYCAIVGVAAAFALALGWLVPRTRQAGAMLVIGLGGSALTGWRAWDALSSAWAPGADDTFAHLGALLAWSPLPYAASLAIVVLFVGTLAGTVGLLFREAHLERRPDRTEVSGHGDLEPAPPFTAAEHQPAPRG